MTVTFGENVNLNETFATSNYSEGSNNTTIIPSTFTISTTSMVTTTTEAIPEETSKASCWKLFSKTEPSWGDFGVNIVYTGEKTLIKKLFHQYKPSTPINTHKDSSVCKKTNCAGSLHNLCSLIAFVSFFILSEIKNIALIAFDSSAAWAKS